MKIALYNAKVYVERERFVEAVLVEDRKIKAIGTNEEILATTDIDEKIEFLRGMLNKFRKNCNTRIKRFTYAHI